MQLVIWPYDGDAVASVIEEANEQNVPVFTFDVKAKGCDVTGQISTDNHMIGETAAHTMAGFLYQKNGAYQGKDCAAQRSVSYDITPRSRRSLHAGDGDRIS